MNTHNDTQNHAATAADAQELAKKAHITGADVGFYVNVYNWLEAIKVGQLIVVGAETPSEVYEEGKRAGIEMEQARAKDEPTAAEAPAEKRAGK